MIDKHNFSEYQIKSINKRKALKFDIELKANKKLKKKLTTSIINGLDVLIEDLLDQGVNFYKINFFEKYKNVETVCVDMEDTVNFCKSEISMIELLYLVLIKNIDNTYSSQCIIATRTLSNYNILSSLKGLFNPLNEDILISQLCGHKNIFASWKDLIKEKNYKFHRFVYFSEFHHCYYGCLAELVVTFYPECGYDLDFIEGALDSNIKGISRIENTNEKICLNLINMYFQSKGLYLYLNNIYKLVKNSKYSYELWDSIYSVNSNILNILKEEYVMQLKKLDIHDLIISCWEDVFKKFLENKPKYFNHIIFNNNVMEFNDGLYFLSQNDFCSFDGFNFAKLENLGCYKYFSQNFEICKNSKPIQFLKSFNMGILEFERFFFNLGFWINSRILKSKDEIIVISDFSDKKNTFTANISLFDLNEKTKTYDLFVVKQQEDKKLLVCTSYLYNDKIEKSESKIKLNEIGILKFKFNENLDEKMLNDKVLLIKLIIYILSFIHSSKVNEIALEKELAKIIVYCNDIFSDKKLVLINNGNLKNKIHIRFEFKFRK